MSLVHKMSRGNVVKLCLGLVLLAMASAPAALAQKKLTFGVN